VECGQSKRQRNECWKLQRWISGKKRLENVTNERIGEIIRVTHTIVDEIKRQLIRFGHVQRMPKTGTPKQVINCKPSWKKKPGRPRRN